MGNKNKVIWCDKGWLPVFYGFCPNKKAWNKEMKRIGLKKRERLEYPGNVGGRVTFFNKEDVTTCIVTIQDNAENERSLTSVAGIIVHEAAHVWQEILDVIGEDNPSPEFEAYSIQNIFQELFKAFEKTRGLPKNANK